ncbi:SGNH/GDSL hydrolase family protein [Actinobacillus pleuropneumoniae]|uniref:Acylneuraminate cytidylyltransferase n=1 Tax=Actinobacillus pleuropneumoniae TaxID=715 RepID=A0A448U1V8_ACTPL|nr:SGNH/GDSL hydrolase family protein [Actinobacillus pleuropneumoniae]EFM86937.1 N-acylneuraminate cytidylyltransferase/lysophospholipase L1 and esterases involved in polysaccharide synthesis [Actinobacillus pleuropneumoniae serovar 2 str. S1536]MBT9319353.1 acylneuraminate cytidylyltransferase [Actinobacillus pleuropneumoniae]MBT9344216.1 acylneuraminate cytidylyltransferase [Actinobacillus pleuropneumoniae]MCL7721622.1 GDSL-type esterase/lipase family protein [Actinobacillus pleuropneumoniae
MLSDADIFQRYQTKRIEFERDTEISLIGHSLFDMWSDWQTNLEFKGQTVANLAISGVSSRQYLDVIAKPQHIKKLGQSVFFFLGVNDIVKEADYSPAQVMEWLLQIIEQIRPLATPNTRYFLLEATPVCRINTVTNAQIQQLNTYLAEHCPPHITFIKTFDAFADHKGDLNADLTTDGLHFNLQGYAVLRQLLESYV